MTSAVTAYTGDCGCGQANILLHPCVSLVPREWPDGGANDRVGWRSGVCHINIECPHGSAKHVIPEGDTLPSLRIKVGGPKPCCITTPTRSGCLNVHVMSCKIRPRIKNMKLFCSMNFMTRVRQLNEPCWMYLMLFHRCGRWMGQWSGRLSSEFSLSSWSGQ